MKKLNIAYWIITVLFSAFMISTALPDILKWPGSDSFIVQLGYPAYFVVFIAYAKTLGSIAILIPGFPRIKEWAYAGLFFDLIGAIYSAVAVAGFDPGMLFMVVILAAFAASYILYHKRLTASQGK